jgi:diguanylate cyclase (GGDEF)-like protein
MSERDSTKVLLVENDPTDAFLVKNYLAADDREVFSVTHVRRVSDALAQLNSFEFDVVLLDLLLPDARGMEVVATVREVAPAIPIVVLADGDTESLAMEATSRGAQDYLVKGRDGGPLLRRALRQAIERKRLEEKVAAVNQYDYLTGLPNRALLRSHLDRAISRSERNAKHLALIFLDIDRFKLINDSYGHLAGDALLRQIADRLKQSVRRSDFVARLGGDEFAILAEELDSIDDARLIAEKILASLVAPLPFQGIDVYATISVGVAVHPGPAGQTVDQLLTAADVAMYRAKKIGRNNYQMFEATMLEATSERLRLESDLHNALKKGEILLHYQPQIDARNGRVVGVEALVRWKHPKHGMVSPAEFIPIAEDVGLIVPIGDFVLATAARQLRSWRESGLDLRVAVNISPAQFRAGQLGRRVSEALEATGLPPRVLELELTESMLVEDARATTDLLKELKALDVRIAIDDFGTGYSSLAYLRRFPLDALKIDRSFVDGLGSEPNDEAIASAVISMSRALGLEVVAEGVETSQQFRFLKDHDCDVAQGFFFSRPLPVDQVEAFCRKTFDVASIGR